MVEDRTPRRTSNTLTQSTFRSKLISKVGECNASFSTRNLPERSSTTSGFEWDCEYQLKR
jgi:hypothetical protein